MKRNILTFAVTAILLIVATVSVEAQKTATTDSVQVTSASPSSASDPNLSTSIDVGNDESLTEDALQESTDSTGILAETVESEGFHQSLKRKFIEGNAGFMSLVALALVLGLAFCIERMIYLSLSEINTKKFMADLEEKMKAGDWNGAKTMCRETRGPIASICYQGLIRINESLDNIERSIVSSGTVQTANMEKGCSWIRLFIAMAPSLGFLGTVIGMVMAFDQIQDAGDISPTIVAAGMKVALITTIFGIIVALILQLFYNYILSKIDRLTAQMEEAALMFLDCARGVKSGDRTSLEKCGE